MKRVERAMQVRARLYPVSIPLSYDMPPSLPSTPRTTNGKTMSQTIAQHVKIQIHSSHLVQIPRPDLLKPPA